MKIAIKIIAFVLLGVFGVLALDGYLAVKRELSLFDQNMRRDARVLGGALRAALAETWARSGERRARALLEQASHGEDRLRIRWVWLEGAAGPPDRPQLSQQRLAAVVQGRTISVRHGQGRRANLLTYLPLRVSSGRLGAIELSETLSHRNAYARETIIRKLYLLGGIALVSGLLLVPLGIHLVGRPLKLLTAEARRVGHGDLSARVTIRGRDELADLASSMNQMCAHLQEARDDLERATTARIEALEQLRHEDRLKSVGRLAAGMAHELGTPLNVVSARADLIASGKLSAEDQVASARTIKEQAVRMTRIIRQILDFARKRPVKRVALDLGVVAASAVDLLEPEARRSDVALRLHRSAERPTPVRGDPEQLTQVLMTLVMNAVQASTAGDEVDIRVDRRDARPPVEPEASPRSHACLQVVDQGAGISPEALPHIFEPFFTTKDVGQGTGLGLSVAHGIVTEHEGWITVDSQLEQGSTFRVYLPLEEES